MTTTIDPSLAKAMEDIRRDPVLPMALSLYNLSFESDYREIGGGLARKYVRNSYNPTGDAGSLADADLIIREEHPALYGMTFHNMLVNLHGYGVDTTEEFPSAPARELVLGIVAANRPLSDLVRALEPIIPF
ncbi:hypothetical protein [Arthrobacter sp. zg-Y1110]|uniref:hypothetical protein n=1 Tax=Arthrobacter sp. zg-Y1110 TaxID=2886932 RepID=UPI001D15ADC1|nr:hypothetical protein [Arthrobacter sp. zg-Y1110]MCC3292387.1 hypothetical protein [Arthrobacter sp. zg-Y1110]UWX86710.1 hypothetical protein N2K99_17870 [Arthrobacter sp. zg-Y1110]